MDITGFVQDADTNAPLNGIVVTVVSNGSGNPVTPAITDTTDSGGNFDLPGMDNFNTGAYYINVSDPSGKYLGGAQTLPGTSPITIQIYQATITNVITKAVPWWVWALVGLAILGGTFKYWKKYLKF
jgi:phosphate/sulfate permease